MKPRVTLLTAVDFWAPGSGHRARIATLVRGLAAEVELTVLLPTPAPAAAATYLATQAPQARLASLGLPPGGQIGPALARLAGFFQHHPQQACIVQMLRLNWMAAAIPPGVMRLIDTHVVASQHDAMLVQRGLIPGPALSAEREAAALRPYDRVIAICEPDARTFAGWLGAGRVLLVPHAPPLHASPHRPLARRLLMVAGDYGPNRDGLAWFLAEVWPRLRAGEPGLQFDIVGRVGPAMGLSSDEAQGLCIHGVVPDLAAAYARADLCINPVSCGGGLKIKTVEALAHGRPLVTTSHGARGLEAQAGSAFAVADSPADFAATVLRLAADVSARERLGQAARQLAASQFGEAACHAPLLQALRSLRPV
jgi:hypothetical protein